MTAKKEKTFSLFGMMITRNFVVYLSIFLIITALPLLIFLLILDRNPIASGWFSDSWLYRKTVTLSAAGSNIDVLVPFDSSTLITQGKMKSDCSDIRFVDSNDTTLLSHWVEGGCNTASTQVWVRVPTSAVGKNIYLYYGNSSATSTSMAWTGKAILYSTAACPAGWTRETVFDNRMAYGSTVYGNTGGASSHNHGGSLSVNTSGNSGGGNVTDGETWICGCHFGHTHTVTGTVSSTASLPPYSTSYVCSRNSLSGTSNLTFLSDSSIPAGWSRETIFDGRIPYGAASAGALGGAGTHTHTFSSLATSAAPNNYCGNITIDGGSTRDVARGGHVHSVTLSSNGAGSNYPPFKTLLFVKNPNATVNAPVISMFSVIPPLGWSRYTALDNFFAAGGTGVNLTAQGSATHSHALSFTVPRVYESSRFIAGVAVGFAPDDHSHTASASISGSSIPPYITVLYGKRTASQSVTLGGEIVGNKAPNAPTSLLTEGLTNPTNIIDMTPEFSAIFSDPDSTDRGAYYQIQVNTASAFNGTMLWDTGQTGFATQVTNGARTPDISYAGSALSYGNTYYWRVRFWDNFNAVSAWSATAQFSTLAIPNTPVMGTPLPSTDKILWNFTYGSGVADGVRLYDGLNNLIKTCVGSSINTCEESGLLENTQYTRKISAYNSAGESVLSAAKQVYTTLRIPSFTILSIASTTMDFTISDRVNDSEILLNCAIGSNCNTGINGWVRSDTQQVTGLENNTLYGFRIKGRNGDSVETEYSDIQTAYTYSVPPTLTVSNITSNSLTVSASGVNNTGVGQTAFFFECIDSSCNDGINEWLVDTSDTVINLFPDTEYKFRVKSKNYDGIESAFSEYVTIRTVSAQPNPVEITDIKTNELKIKIDATNNPATTQYLVQESKSGKYVDAVSKVLIDTPEWFTYTQYGGLNGIVLTNLLPNTEYSFVIKAKNSLNIETEFSESTDIVTKISTPTGFKASSITTNEIIWTVDAPTAGTVTGYRIYDENSSLILTCTLEDITSSNCKETNLTSNTIYKRSIQAYNSLSDSAKTELLSFNTMSESVKVASATPVTYGSVLLKLTGSTRDSIQVFETTEQKYYDRNTGVLLSFTSSLPFAESITVSGLAPNKKYTFQARSSNKDGVFSEWSEVISVSTFAQPPITIKVDRVTSNSARVYINTLENPTYTEFAIKETNSGKYIDFSSSTFIDSPKYGKFTDFGGSNGILINGLEVGQQYGFSVAGRNMNGVLTVWSNPIFIGAKAIILNVQEGINVVLSEDDNIDLTLVENGQLGEQKVKVYSGLYIVAEIPILFSKDRDWSEALIDMSASEKKTVVKLSEDQGLANKYTMFVVGNDTNSFMLCPEAKSLSEVSLNCAGGVKYTGEFPQSKDVEASSVTVSKAVIGNVTYWIADGLTGTGGLGYNEEKESSSGSDTSTTTTATSKVANTFISALANIPGRIEGLVKSWMSSTDESTNLTNTATVSTVTVATTAVSTIIASGGILPVIYAIGQFFTSILVALGFKKKEIPYGMVYNSRTKEPLSMAVVRIFEESGKLVNSSVTDGKGRFMTRLNDGKYVLQVSKGGFLFPSRIITEGVDYPLTHVYKGSITVKKEDIDVEVAIPMDPVDIDSSARNKVVMRSFLSNAIVFLNLAILIVGTAISAYIYIKNPTTFNLLIPLIYVIPLSFVIYPLLRRRNKYWVVTNSEKMPLSDIPVLLKDPEFDRILEKRVTDEKGRYRFVVDEGSYKIEVENNSAASKIVKVERDGEVVGENFVN